MIKDNTTGRTQIKTPIATDNAGNAIGIGKDRFKHWPMADIMMELAITAQQADACISVSHVKREHNKWADQLSNGDTKGFDKNKRHHFDLNDQTNWWIWHELRCPQP